MQSHRQWLIIQIAPGKGEHGVLGKTAFCTLQPNFGANGQPTCETNKASLCFQTKRWNACPFTPPQGRSSCPVDIRTLTSKRGPPGPDLCWVLCFWPTGWPQRTCDGSGRRPFNKQLYNGRTGQSQWELTGLWGREPVPVQASQGEHASLVHRGSCELSFKGGIDCFTKMKTGVQLRLGRRENQ